MFLGGGLRSASAAASSPIPVTLVNPGFESGDLTGWTVTDSTYGGAKAQDAYAGTYSFNYWNQDPYKVTLSQKVSHLADGKYELRAWAQGKKENAALKLFAESGNRNFSVDIVNDGWAQWKQYSVTDIEVVNGEVTIGFSVDAGTDDFWGSVDEFELVKADTNTQPYDPSQFIKGADISTLQALEDAGVKFYDEGQEKGLLTILKDHGVNYIRLRLWNEPVQAGADPRLGGYYNDKAHTVAMAKRVKDAGFKLLLDFHYSDFWADPGQQVKPAAWANLDFAGLKQAVYDYTYEVLTELDHLNAYPDMVQVGNEINNGMIFPEGSTSNFDNLAELLSEGSRAVRDTTPQGQDTKIMLHLAEGGDNGKFRAFFDEVKKRNVDYDIIGLSYYPYWHGTFQDLKSNMNDLVARYGKQVIVAETAYAYTYDDADGHGNIVSPAETDLVGFPASVENQKLVTETVFNTVASVNGHNGLGAFYWEPAWLQQVGWKAGEGNAWENQAMFDFEGNALDSLDAFRYVPGSIPDVLPILVYPSVGVTVSKGETPELPAKVNVLYNEGTIKPASVVWDAIPEAQLHQPGKFTVEGTVTGYTQKAKIEVTVLKHVNYAKNHGFESGDLTDWTLTGTSGAGKVVEKAADVHSGTHGFNYWYDQDFAYELTQTVTGLPNGTYTLKAWASGQGGDTVLQLFAKDSAGTVQKTDMVNTGWNAWKQYSVENIKVTDGRLTIGFKVEAPAQVWGWIDDIELIQNETDPEEPTNPTTPTNPSTPSAPSTSTPSTSGTAGTGGKDHANASQEVVTITSDQLKPAVSGTVTVNVPADANTVNVPGKVVSTLGGNALEVTNGSLSISIPAELLKKWGEDAGGMNSPGIQDWSISLKLDRQAEETFKQTLNRAAVQDEFTDIKIAGPVYHLKLSLTSGGTEKEVSTLETPITVTLKPSGEIDQNIAGIYSVIPEGKLIYAGGQWVSGQFASPITRFGQYALLEVDKRFGDVADAHWANQAVSGLAARQILTGTASGVFEPGRAVTRAEFVAMLARALKLESKAASGFKDVPEGAWYANAVDAAYEAGLVKGKDGMAFDPNAAISRQEMAVMLMNAYAYAGGTASGNAAASGTFKDAAEISDWAAAAVTSAQSAGMIQGSGEGRFAPKASLTRAEAAQAVYRLLNK